MDTGLLFACLLLASVFVAVALEGWVLLRMLGQHGRLLLRLDAIEAHLRAGPPVPAVTAGMPEGTPAPAFRLEGIYGETLTLKALQALGKPVLLLFTDPGCGPCNALMPDLERWQRDHANRLTVAVIGRGPIEANRTKATEHGLTNVLLQRDREVTVAYRVTGTPSAVVIGLDGTIGSPVAGGADAVRQLVAGAIRVPTPAEVAILADKRVEATALAHRSNGRHGLVDGGVPAVVPDGVSAAQQGDPAPPIKLFDLDGEAFDLARHRGQQVALLFWDPGCGFCQRIIHHLREWEAGPPEGRPRIVLISHGPVDANRELGLRSRILLDEDFATGHAFGATGTPSAVLIDADGRVASGVAAGGNGVLDLIGYRAASCEPCVEECHQRGGGDACRTVCQIAGRCI